MIAVDTNVIVPLYLETQESTTVEQILEIDSRWIAPRLWRSEFRNVLVLYLRRELLDLERAITVMLMASDLMLDGEYDVPSSPVLRLAHASECRAYDCEFVVLAQDLRVPLLTFDRQILDRFPGIAVFPRDYIRTQASRGE